MRHDLRPLSDLVEVFSGGGAPQHADSFSDSGHPFVRAASLPKLLSGLDEDSLEKVAEQAAGEHRLRLFPPETVLFAKSGMSALKGHIYRLRGPAYVVNHLAALVPINPADGRFVERVLQFDSPTRLVQDAGYPSIRLPDIRNMRVPTPSTDSERRRIADVLDRTDSLRAKRRSARRQVEALRRSIFLDMFGDPRRNPRGWPVRPLSSLVRGGDRINYGVVQPGSDDRNGVPLIRAGDLTTGEVSPTSLKRISPVIEARYRRSRLRGDEILVSCVGSIGSVALANDSLRDFNIARAVARIPLSADADRSYLAEYLRTESVQRYFKEELRTVGQPTLNIKQLSETRIMSPPLHLQKDFARKVNAVGDLTRAWDSSLKQLEALDHSIQTRIFGAR